jgi:glucans biosynthesis protein
MRDDEFVLDRRSLIGGLASGAVLLGLGRGIRSAGAAPGSAFSARIVQDEAAALAAQPYAPPAPVAEGLQDLDYELYRQIRYRKDEAIWGSAPTAFSVELFAPGFLFKTGVDVFVVESGQSAPVAIGPNTFETPGPEVAALLVEEGRFAGFRLHYPMKRPEYRDEFIVFQGASYFRAVSAGQAYGLSARGLAIDVAGPEGEEFPTFRRFWIERPSAHSDAIVVHALLDSESVAGAYRFAIYPGASTRVDVEATLFAREPLDHVGLGPLTSMFFYGPIDGPDRPDYRPAVHDSLGLAMKTGAGEWLWRPLSNPDSLQVSAFVDHAPKGFGLIQRDRRFESFQDLEAAYEKRPSAWVTPQGDWGPGHVELVEIPSDSETNDNIVAFWRPGNRIEPGAPFRFAYRLTWPDDSPGPRGLARVTRSARGHAWQGVNPQYAIDYGKLPGGSADGVSLDIGLSAGTVTDQVIQPIPQTGGFRVFVTFDPGDAPVCELRVQPRKDGVPIGETWLYRWVRG